MNIEFDAAKDRENTAKHGVSLDRAVEIDLGAALLFQDVRFNYGEDRWVAYGMMDRRLYCLVFTYRAQTIRVISLRKANGREIKRFSP